jgi:hypothetical protein
MIVDQDIDTKGGMLVTTKRQEVSQPVLERLQLLTKGKGLVEPFRVLIRTNFAEPWYIDTDNASKPD